MLSPEVVILSEAKDLLLAYRRNHSSNIVILSEAKDLLPVCCGNILKERRRLRQRTQA